MTVTSAEKRQILSNLPPDFLETKTCCEYCGLTEKETRLLYEHYPECTRGGKRGKRLEWDRKNPFLPYSNTDNLVKACYWCNNAKTNYFSYEEFKVIGPAIGAINQARIASIKRNFTSE